MNGTFKLDQVRRVRHIDEPNDLLFFFPQSEVLELPIQKVVNPHADISLDDIQLLLVAYRDNFKLFMRDYQDPEDVISVDDKIKTRYLELLRYEPPGDQKTRELVWRLLAIEALESISPWYKSQWRKQAVLAIRRGANAGEYNLQILQLGSDFYCRTHCCPAPDSRDDFWENLLCTLSDCPPCP